ncbi:dienelactone hydrolase family protein [Hymenobacter ginsengisoli]|uniref:Dienelactone hydrolase family protein n=1 Tax=Hymenobacter ginsengisoli TaxID=1051626 RepID=A0ABP8QQP5_9BACT|nr:MULTISPECIES: dienelactone hydrolase family protein [unclassified Hymenobacter]MBO2032766.1 dienelactone hydrolase family protein [Hymenobacter sp. BT559]
MSTPNPLVLNVADSTQMHAYVAQPQHTAGAPGIILFQEAFGVNGHIRNVADRLAAAGYVVVAPELFHRTAEPGLEIPYDNFAAAMPHYGAITPEGLAHDAQAAYDWLQAQPNVQNDKIAAIGFCLGGRVAFVANAVLPLQAAVSYYGGGLHTLTDRAKDLHAPHLFFWGGLDQHISKDNIHTIIDAVDAAGKPYINTVISYADHGFHCDERPSYNKDAAAEAWALTLAFFKEKLGA